MNDPRLRRRACVLCGKPVDDHYRPFCSKRCADLDLGNWLSGVYAIAAVEPPSLVDDEQIDRAFRELLADGGEPS